VSSTKRTRARKAKSMNAHTSEEHERPHFRRAYAPSPRFRCPGSPSAPPTPNTHPQRTLTHKHPPDGAALPGRTFERGRCERLRGATQIKSAPAAASASSLRSAALRGDRPPQLAISTPPVIQIMASLVETCLSSPLLKRRTALQVCQSAVVAGCNQANCVSECCSGGV
jgi:hypothetical protein